MKKNVADYWFSLSDKIRFLFVGGFNFVFAYFLFVLFLMILGKENYQLNLILSCFFSSFVSFFTQRFLVFRSNGNFIKDYLKCFTTWMLRYVINAVLLQSEGAILHMNVVFAQMGAACLAAIVTYVLLKNFAFKKR